MKKGRILICIIESQHRKLLWRDAAWFKELLTHNGKKFECTIEESSSERGPMAIFKLPKHGDVRLQEVHVARFFKWIKHNMEVYYE